MQDFPNLCSNFVQVFGITICLGRSPPLLAVSLLVGRPRLVGREEEGKASKFSPAGRRVAQPSPSPVEPASRGKGGTAADETERGMDKCDQQQVCKCSTISSSLSLALSQARENDDQVGEMPSVQSAEFGPIREISDVGESCRRHISNLRP